MTDITQQLKKTINTNPIKDKKRLKHQQEYYHRLKKEGIAQKQAYSLKSISAI